MSKYVQSNRFPLQAFRQKYETEMKDRFDTHFYVGTIHRYPKEWIIVGLFYPMKENDKPMPLFDLVPPDEYSH